ncbi:MAG: hypothetical protein ACRBG0_18045 [Lewinella sp.]|jgi:hypothetical protein|uniref:hypothetical protein n=1 Tax=Lewinella sp. TaxID=2004506 RepID=UPI003D6BC055
MKNLSLFFCILFCSILSIQAQGDRFETAMQGVLVKMETTDGQVAWEEISNQLERIASAEPDQWLPQYYLGYTSLQLALGAMQEGNSSKVTELVKRGEAYLAQARTLTADNSELKCLEGYVYQGYIWIDPMANGGKYSPLAHQAYATAAAMDETNPRPAMLRGMLVLFTPEFFGGGAEKALPFLNNAEELFANEAKAEKGIAPHWGALTNTWMLQKATDDLESKE